MLTTSFGRECPHVEVNAVNLNFIRRGIGGTLGGAERKRRADSSFNGYPAAKLHLRGFVYCRVRNIDGKLTQKSFKVKPSDDEAVLRQRQEDAAMLAQQHFDEHNVATSELGDDVPSDDAAEVAEGSHDGVEAAPVDAEQDAAAEPAEVDENQ